MARPAGVCLTIVLFIAVMAPGGSAPVAAQPHVKAPAGRAHHAHHMERPDGQAPIGVMGDHTHHRNDVMVSYRYMRMNMTGNRNGTTRMSTGDVLRSYPVSPTRMTMDMHMISLMYAPTDRLTLMGMLPLIRLEMDHVTRTGRKFTTRSNGPGDIRLDALYRVLRTDHHNLHLNAGISFPTGDIEPRGNTPMGRALLPYPMRTGTGTYDLIPGLTYNGRTDDYSWGAQGLMRIRMGRNARHYRVGHQFESTAWFARRWSRWVSTAVRLDWALLNDMTGADKRLMPMVVPTADPALGAGSRLEGGVSLNFLVPRGPLRGNRLGVEFLFPLYQSIDGPRLETESRLIAGWQYLF